MEKDLPKRGKRTELTRNRKDEGFFEDSFDPRCRRDLITYIDEHFSPSSPIQHAYEILHVLGAVFEGERKRPINEQPCYYVQTKNRVLDVIGVYSSKKNWERRYLKWQKKGS